MTVLKIVNATKHVRASRNLGIRIYYCICLFDIYMSI